MLFDHAVNKNYEDFICSSISIVHPLPLLPSCSRNGPDAFNDQCEGGCYDSSEVTIIGSELKQYLPV